MPISVQQFHRGQRFDGDGVAQAGAVAREMVALDFEAERAAESFLNAAIVQHVFPITRVAEL